MINQLNDINGKLMLAFNAVTNAVNGVRFTNAITGATPKIAAYGTDTNVSLDIAPQGSGSVAVRDGNNAQVASFAGVASAVNRATVTNAATGGAVTIGATGSDGTVALNLTTKGGAPVKVNNVDVATKLSATASLDFGSVTAQSYEDKTITVTGAVSGDAIALGVPTAAITAGVAFTAWVSAADTVTVRAHNYAGTGSADIASGTFKATAVR